MARGQFPASRMWPNDRKKAFFENVSADICGHISDSPFAPSPDPLTVSRRVPPSPPLSLSSPLNIEHLNIWTFEHLNIGTFGHVDICSIQHSICGHISVWHLASGIWHLAYDIWYMRSHFEHVHIYLHVHMFTCSHFYHIWKCERRYMRSHSRVKVVEPNDFPRSPTFFLPLTPSSPLIIEHLNIWTFEHLNIGTLEHLDMLISAAFNILYAFTFLSALTFLSVLPYPQSSGRMCRGDFYLFSFESVNADICGHISICVHISAQNVNADIWRGIS